MKLLNIIDTNKIDHYIKESQIRQVHQYYAALMNSERIFFDDLPHIQWAYSLSYWANIIRCWAIVPFLLSKVERRKKPFRRPKTIGEEEKNPMYEVFIFRFAAY